MGKCTGYTTTINHQYDMACGFERAMIFKNNDDQPMDLWVMLIDLLRWTSEIQNFIGRFLPRKHCFNMF